MYSTFVHTGLNLVCSICISIKAGTWNNKNYPYILSKVKTLHHNSLYFVRKYWKNVFTKA